MKRATRSSLGKLMRFLDELEGAKIAYQLEHVRDSIMVVAAVPGQRWEIEFFDDGEVEIERYVSSGKIEDEGILGRLVAEHGS